MSELTGNTSRRGIVMKANQLEKDTFAMCVVRIVTTFTAGFLWIMALDLAWRF